LSIAACLCVVFVYACGVYCSWGRCGVEYSGCYVVRSGGDAERMVDDIMSRISEGLLDADAVPVDVDLGLTGGGAWLRVDLLVLSPPVYRLVELSIRASEGGDGLCVWVGVRVRDADGDIKGLMRGGLGGCVRPLREHLGSLGVFTLLDTDYMTV